MANTIPSPNMNLPIPVAGVDLGPDYALNIDACLQRIDGHTHASGQGVQVQPSGLNISSDLNIQNNNLINVRSVRLQAQLAPLALVSDIGCLYEAGVDLYYNDLNGQQIRITQSGAVAGASGTITGLPSGTASASYGAGVFVFQSATSTSAVLDAGSIILRNNAASSHGLTLSPPNAMAADYALVLPALPVSTSVMNLDSSGNMGTWALDNSTLTVSAGTLVVKTGGITQTQLAANSVGTAQIIDANVTPAKLSAATYAISATTSFTTSGTVMLDTGMTVTITTHGRPVLVFLQVDPGGGYVDVNTAGCALMARMYRDTTPISGSEWSTFSPSTGLALGIAWTQLDIVTAGSHTYKIQVAKGPGGTGSVGFIGCQLVAVEL